MVTLSHFRQAASQTIGSVDEYIDTLWSIFQKDRQECLVLLPEAMGAELLRVAMDLYHTANRA